MYFVSLNGQVVVDQGDPLSSTAARWANHRCGGGNAQMVVETVAGVRVALLKATTDMLSGAEVLWDYSCTFNPAAHVVTVVGVRRMGSVWFLVVWDDMHHSPTEPSPCCCRAPRCRGVILSQASADKYAAWRDAGPHRASPRATPVVFFFVSF